MQIENNNNRAQNQQGISLNAANSAIRGIDNLYWATYQLGYHLPKRDSACISAKYLLGVMNSQFICPKRDSIQAGQQTVKICSKIDLYSEINALSPGDLGFDIAKLPDKQWLVDFLYSKKSNHPYFVFSQLVAGNDQNILLPLQLLREKGINLNVFPNMLGTLFKKSKEQREHEKSEKLRKRIEKKEKRMSMLQYELEKVEGRKRELEDELE